MSKYGSKDVVVPAGGLGEYNTQTRTALGGAADNFVL